MKIKLRIDVHGNVGAFRQRSGELRRHNCVFFEPLLGARAISCSFLLQQFLGERCDCRRHFLEVDFIETGRGIATNRALFSEIAELHHRAGAVGLGNSEADSAESFAEKRGVNFI